MRAKRRISAFAVAFAAVMVGGAAAAAVGAGPSLHRADQAAQPAPAISSPTLRATDARAGAPTDVAPEPGDDTPPRIEIVEPHNGAEFALPHLSVFGTTEPGAVVTLGDRKADVDDNGKWWIRAELERGENVLVFVATDAAGNSTRARLIVYFVPPDADWRFTAHQRWEIVDGTPVVNVYWGTSKPGSEVTIRSEYGHGATTTSNDGTWELRVEFPTAPCNEYFRVVAQSGDHHQDFKMKRACAVDVGFVAHQKYGECAEPVPYDVFWGSASPGASIAVASPFGKGSTTAGPDGNWELKVEFAEAPQGVSFDVVVESSDGGRAVFAFVYVGPPE